MDSLRWILILVVFVGMAVLCVVGWDIGGMGGAIGGAAGALWRAGGKGYDAGERLGNIFSGAITGMPFGLLLGGIYAFGWPYLMNAYR